MQTKFKRKSQDRPLGNLGKVNKNKDFDMKSETLTEKNQQKTK
ncbi:hypothetical protein JCM19275_1640 [Nonlabens ulvanivorans]|uniref:Uncharacterized protein n=1 Tax=Nonlabens ulvanivorans TaxID=906888 RepID=A0A090X3B8_NONUL|nr:hypothetical protein [Nonlabens ulvanivorans]WOI23795.1 hypothetical protein R1T42_04900 [Nonlabens ulvanivorans]GAL75757.1 hypothetical protein JCM19275_1640 [Nonlabens ulvanivorans]